MSHTQCVWRRCVSAHWDFDPQITVINSVHSVTGFLCAPKWQNLKPYVRTSVGELYSVSRWCHAVTKAVTYAITGSTGRGHSDLPRNSKCFRRFQTVTGRARDSHFVYFWRICQNLTTVQEKSRFDITSRLQSLPFKCDY